MMLCPPQRIPGPVEIERVRVGVPRQLLTTAGIFTRKGCSRREIETGYCSPLTKIIPEVVAGNFDAGSHHPRRDSWTYTASGNCHKVIDLAWWRSILDCHCPLVENAQFAAALGDEVIVRGYEGATLTASSTPLEYSVRAANSSFRCSLPAYLGDPQRQTVREKCTGTTHAFTYGEWEKGDLRKPCSTMGPMKRGILLLRCRWTFVGFALGKPQIPASLPRDFPV